MDTTIEVVDSTMTDRNELRDLLARTRYSMEKLDSNTWNVTVSNSEAVDMVYEWADQHPNVEVRMV